MFENKKYKGIYYSRFLASWINVGGSNDYEFEDWLNSILIDGEHIPNDIIEEIYRFNYYFVGKLELETDARRYRKQEHLDEYD